MEVSSCRLAASNLLTIILDSGLFMGLEFLGTYHYFQVQQDQGHRLRGTPRISVMFLDFPLAVRTPLFVDADATGYICINLSALNSHQRKALNEVYVCQPPLLAVLDLAESH